MTIFVNALDLVALALAAVVFVPLFALVFITSLVRAVRMRLGR